MKFGIDNSGVVCSMYKSCAALQQYHGMFSFIVAWNHLLYVIILISKPDFANVPLGLRNNYMQQVAAGDIGYNFFLISKEFSILGI